MDDKIIDNREMSRFELPIDGEAAAVAGLFALYKLGADR